MSYVINKIESAVDRALHPSGMSTHSGRVTLDCSHVIYLTKAYRLLVDSVRALSRGSSLGGGPVLGHVLPSRKEVDAARKLLSDLGEQ